MKVQSIFSGSVLIAVALLSFSLTFTATTLSAETLSSQDPQPIAITPKGSLGEKIAVEEVYVAPPTSYSPLLIVYVAALQVDGPLPKV